jgi:hypothetical protein
MGSFFKKNGLKNKSPGAIPGLTIDVLIQGKGGNGFLLGMTLSGLIVPVKYNLKNIF